MSNKKDRAGNKSSSSLRTRKLSALRSSGSRSSTAKSRSVSTSMRVASRARCKSTTSNCSTRTMICTRLSRKCVSIRFWFLGASETASPSEELISF
jgi:hypothetical protein